jgi:gliding motility-associated-like protein
VNVLPIPQVNIPENELNVCIGSSATIRVENPSVNLSYNWSPTDGITTATDLPEISITPSVSARYLVTATDGKGCQGVDSINVMVTALPTVDIQPSSVTLCNDDPVTLTAVSPTQNLSYSWSPSVGLSSVSTASVSARPPSTTQYTVTVTDEFGCVGADDAEVVIATRPFVQVQPSSTKICLGESVDLGTLASGPGLTYEWSPAATLNTTSGPAVVATPTATTRYKVSVTTNEGCTTADSVIILVSAVAPPIFQPAVPLVCAGSSITIRITNLGSDVRYVWTPTTGLSAAEGSTIIANPSVTTTYTVTASDEAGCQATGTITVNTAPLPVIDATPTSASICLGSSVCLRATSPSVGVNFDWTPTIGLSSPTGAIVSAKPIRSTTYRLTGTDNNGCSSSMDIPVTVLPVPSVNAGPDYLIPVGDRIQLDPIVSADVTDYLWSPALGLSCLTCSKPELQPRSSGTYILEVRNSSGCTSADSLRVELICSDKNLFIPNTFSPNGDGVNDVFYPRGVGMSKVEFLRIFDRWGNMVFEKLNFNIEDKSAGWNGTIKGSFAPPGVYVYTARLVCDNNEILNVKGSITLIH